MIIVYDKSFLKSIDKVTDKSIKTKLLTFIEEVKNTEAIQNLSSVKKIKGYKNYYRYRLGNYRLGFEKTDEKTVVFIIVAKRNDIYKKFP